MKILFTALLAGHGLVHLIGFLRAFGMMEGKGYTIPVTKPMGILWLAAFVFFEVVAVLFYLNYRQWWIFGSLAVVLSQFLIIYYWHDAKFGTLVNIVVIFVIILDYGAWHYKSRFIEEVNKGLHSSVTGNGILDESDIALLPQPVQKYIRYTGSLGKPEVQNFRAEFTGQIRKNELSPWMPLHAVQYSFMDEPTRLFYMDATMKSVPVRGFHCFKNGDAFMDIRVLSMIPVQHQEGKEMGIAETVTFFNDMCFMAPASLIDKRIEWLETNGNKVKARFTNNNIAVSAILTFNGQGQLINFESDDRYAVDDEAGMRRLPWSTPMKDYHSVGGFNLCWHGDVVYDYPEGQLVYGQFVLNDIRYNCNKYSDI